MRNEFVKSLIKLAAKDKNIFLLCGDLGYSVLEPFAELYPDRFINIGIAEQNMIGIAAGLALSGKKVFTYSIVNFAVTRCLEQIRNDICYHNLDVTVVAVGGGMPYGSQGYTHLGIEDIAFTRNLPNIKVMVPADKTELNYTMQRIELAPGPHYLRLGRGGESDVHSNLINHSSSPIIELIPANEITVLTTGSILFDAYTAINKLDENIGLISIPEISNNTREILTKYLSNLTNTKHIITIEEHLIYGGFGSFIAEVLLTLNLKIKLSTLGIKHCNITEIGDQSFLKKQNGIDVQSITNLLKASLYTTPINIT